MHFSKLISILLISLIYFSDIINAQIPIGAWRDHLAYSNTTNVIKANNKIWCSSPYALFYFDKNDNSIGKLSKANGLSDFGISSINYNSDNEALVVAYNNANIDIIYNNSIKNINYIKQAQIQGNKNIYKIVFQNNIAYLACGFGIVVLDIENLEIKETYYIGNNAAAIEVYDICFDENYIYAATEEGIYFADKNSNNLIDYNYWSKISSIPNPDQKFTSIINFNNNILANYYNSTENASYIYKKEGENWVLFYNSENLIKKISYNDNYLSITEDSKISIYSNNLIIKEIISNYNLCCFKPNDCYIDENYNIYIGDREIGLVKRESNLAFQSFYPNGPFENSVVDISEENNNVWVAAGGRTSFWGNLYKYAEAFHFENETWRSKVLWESNARDFVKILVNSHNSSQVFAGAWGTGVFEFINGDLQNAYNEQNSSLQSILPGGEFIRIGGLAIDENQNLWVTNSGVNYPISVKTANNEWQSLEYPEISGQSDVGEIIICSNNNKWVQLARGGGLFAFNHNNTPTDYSDDDHKKFSITDENGIIITNDVYSIAVDQDDVVWVGTDKGVITYFNASNVFDGNNFYADRIKLVDENYDSIVQYLLGNEKITSIEIDGANRKWFGTENSGVFLMSADGQKEIFNFNSENSPLFSNNITDIKVNSVTGEVFFGTDLGLISYKGTATKGDNAYKNAYIYPNPVRENYEGEITITGIAKNANVKITNISGKLVYETTAFGGQAIWNGRDFSGQKVYTGVYLVFCTDSEGKYKKVLKLLIIN